MENKKVYLVLNQWSLAINCRFFGDAIFDANEWLFGDAHFASSGSPKHSTINVCLMNPDIYVIYIFF